MFAPKGSTWRTLLFTSFFGFFGDFYFGYAISYTNTAADVLKAFIDDAYENRGTPLSPTTSIWLWSFNVNCFTLGALVATLFVPVLTDKWGRKFCLFIGNAGMVLASLLGAVSIITALPECFIFSRILGSIMATVAGSSWMLMLMEFPVTNLKGNCFYVSETSYAALSLLGMALGMKIFLEANVLLLVALGAVPSFICCIVVFFIEDSPKYLLINCNDRKAAREAVIYYQGKNVDHEVFLNETLKEAENSELNKTSLQILVDVLTTPHLRRALFLGMCSLHAILGIWPITTRLLKDHFSAEMSQIFSTSLFGVNFASCIIGVFVVSRFSIFSDKVKRRFLIISSSMVNILSLLAFVIFDRLAAMVSPVFSYAGIAAMLSYNLSYGIGIGVIAFYITGELLPQMHRSTGQSVVSFVTLVLGFVFTFVTLPAYEYYTSLVFIPLFVVPGLLCNFYLYLYLPETKGRETHEIVEELKISTNFYKLSPKNDC